MKTFRDLFIHLEGHSVEELVSLLTDRCHPPWTRETSKEEDLPGLSPKMFCFERSADEQLPGAALFITNKEADVWYVPNIVPTETGELGYDTYNKILLEFKNSVLHPAVENTGIKVNVTEDHVFIKDVAGHDVEAALIQFSNLANKSTGSSHPRDRERWFRFLVLANNKEADLSGELVIRTLVELGWSEERAYDLGIEFEFSQELLDFAKSH